MSQEMATRGAAEQAPQARSRKKPPAAQTDSSTDLQFPHLVPPPPPSQQAPQQRPLSMKPVSSPQPPASVPGTPRSRSAGLSELAQQLRVMQAQNETLTAEVRRLERQLKIAAELSGVSIKDLQACLARACESEAYGELRHRVAQLQAQLDESRLRQAPQRVASNNFEQEKDAKRIANLQLRIGELEEVEQNLRKELAGLYQSQQEHLTTNNDLQRRIGELENVERNLRAELADLHSSLQQNLAATTTNREVQKPAPPPGVSSETKPKDQSHKKNDKQIRLLQSQVAAREKDLELQKSQYKTRFSLQEGRITDLEQQLSSLYVAFEMLDTEHQTSKANADKLSKQLNMADSQVAKAVLLQERSNKATPTPPTPNHSNVVPSSPSRLSVQTTPSFVSDDSSQASSFASPFAMTRANSFPSHQFTASQPSSRSVVSTATPEDVVLVQGTVFVRHSGRLGGGGWKRKYAKVRRASSGLGQYELVVTADVNDSPKGRKRHSHSNNKADVYALIPQQSTYALTREFAPQHPYCFHICTDPSQRVPSVTLASPNEGDFDIWMVALQEATQQRGDIANVSQQKRLLDEHRRPIQDDVFNASLQAAMRESLREHQQRSSTSFVG